MSVPIGCMKFLFVNLYLPMVFGHHFWLELIFPPSDWDTPSAHPRPLSPPIRRAWAYYLVPIIRVPRFKIFRTNSLAPNPICWVPPPPVICFHTKGMSERDLRACSLFCSLSFSAFGSYARNAPFFIFGESHGWCPRWYGDQY
jgi:hypothetical protein